MSTEPVPEGAVEIGCDKHGYMYGHNGRIYRSPTRVEAAKAFKPPHSAPKKSAPMQTPSVKLRQLNLRTRAVESQDVKKATKMPLFHANRQTPQPMPLLPLEVPSLTEGFDTSLTFVMDNIANLTFDHKQAHIEKDPDPLRIAEYGTTPPGVESAAMVLSPRAQELVNGFISPRHGERHRALGYRLLALMRGVQLIESLAWIPFTLKELLRPDVRVRHNSILASNAPQPTSPPRSSFISPHGNQAKQLENIQLLETVGFAMLMGSIDIAEQIPHADVQQWIWTILSGSWTMSIHEETVRSLLFMYKECGMPLLELESFDVLFRSAQLILSTRQDDLSRLPTQNEYNDLIQQRFDDIARWGQFPSWGIVMQWAGRRLETVHRQLQTDEYQYRDSMLKIFFKACESTRPCNWPDEFIEWLVRPTYFSQRPNRVIKWCTLMAEKAAPSVQIARRILVAALIARNVVLYRQLRSQDTGSARFGSVHESNLQCALIESGNGPLLQTWTHALVASDVLVTTDQLCAALRGSNVAMCRMLFSRYFIFRQRNADDLDPAVWQAQIQWRYFPQRDLEAVAKAFTRMSPFDTKFLKTEILERFLPEEPAEPDASQQNHPTTKPEERRFLVALLRAAIQSLHVRLVKIILCHRTGKLIKYMKEGIVTFLYRNTDRERIVSEEELAKLWGAGTEDGPPSHLTGDSPCSIADLEIWKRDRAAQILDMLNRAYVHSYPLPMMRNGSVSRKH